MLRRATVGVIRSEYKKFSGLHQSLRWGLHDLLVLEVAARPEDLREAGIRTLQKIGDCDVPGAVVHATYAGHRLAREFDANVAPMLFERTRLDS